MPQKEHHSQLGLFADLHTAAAVTEYSPAMEGTSNDHLTVVVVKAIGSLGVGAVILVMVAAGCGFDGAPGTGTDGSGEAASGDAGNAAEAPRTPCAAAPALIQIPPVAPAMDSAAVDLGESGVALIALSVPGGLAYAKYDTAGQAYLGSIMGGPSVSITELTGLSPRGAFAIGDDMNQALFCGAAPCVSVGTLAHLKPGLTIALAINDAPIVVGKAVLDGALGVHAYFWTPTGAMTDIGTLGGARSAAKAVNATGKIVGDSTLASGDTHAFLWDGTMHDLGTLGGAFSSAAAINAAGDVVGVARTAAGADHAVLWHAGRIQDLGTLGGSRSEAVAINASGQVVGNSFTKVGFMHAFFWSNGVMQDVGDLGGVNTLIEARRPLNDAGQVLVGGATAQADSHAFVWERGHIRDLGTLGGPNTYGVAIDNSGRVVANSYLESGLRRAFFVDLDACTP